MSEARSIISNAICFKRTEFINERNRKNRFYFPVMIQLGNCVVVVVVLFLAQPKIKSTSRMKIVALTNKMKGKQFFELSCTAIRQNHFDCSSFIILMVGTNCSSPFFFRNFSSAIHSAAL